jgi:hypothetical protein
LISRVAFPKTSTTAHLSAFGDQFEDAYSADLNSQLQHLEAG